MYLRQETSDSYCPFCVHPVSFIFPKTRLLLIRAYKTRLLLVSGELVGFRGEWRSDLNSPPIETPTELFLAKTQFSLAGFLAAQFLLGSGQPIGF
jgi:hypothetical protein